MESHLSVQLVCVRLENTNDTKQNVDHETLTGATSHYQNNDLVMTTIHQLFQTKFWVLLFHIFLNIFP